MGGQSVKRRTEKRKTKDGPKEILLSEFGVAIPYSRFVSCDVVRGVHEISPDGLSGYRQFEPGDTAYITIKFEVDIPRGDDAT